MFTCNVWLCFLLRVFQYHGQIAGWMKSLKQSIISIAIIIIILKVIHIYNIYI